MPPADIPAPPILARLLAPAPARVWRRALALVLDTLLSGVTAMALLTAIVLPQNYPGWSKTVTEQWQSDSAEFQH
ncbi:MAG TPA: hypothetical protein VK737_09045, partial [Opitutales bacterium]|nr:hypothetical protein [Opitutales bacterium]